MNEPAHGTYCCYLKHKCRCEPCRAAWREWYRAWRRRRKEQQRCIECGDNPPSGDHVRCEECNRQNCLRTKLNPGKFEPGMGRRAA